MWIENVEHALSAHSGKLTQAGAGTTVGSWILSSEGGVAIGVVVAVIGLALQWYYSRKRDKREQEEHDLRMVEIRRGVRGS